MIQSSATEQRFRAKLRAFLQEFGYKDGIGFVQWERKAGEIAGIFADRAGDKTFEFSISNDGLAYKPASSLKQSSFAREMARGGAVRKDAKQKRNCSSPTSYSCGASCINNNKQCRIRDLKARQAASGLLRESVTIIQTRPSSPEQVKQALDREESKIRNLRYERGVVIDSKNGDVLLNKGGGQAEVFFSADEMRRMKGQVLTHNHPSVPGFSFSPDDLLCACIGEVSEVRAVSVGYTHSMLPPPEGFNQKFFAEKIAPSYDRNYQANFEFAVGEVIGGRMSAREADVLLMHYTWEQVAYETGMTYTRTQAPRRSWWG